MPYFPPIQQDQYPATDDTQCVRVIIPAGDEFKALLSGLIVEAADPLNYADPDSTEADGLSAIWDDALSQIVWDGCEPMAQYGSTQIDVWARFATVSGGTFVRQNADYMTFRHYMLTDTTTTRNLLQYVWLVPGEYDYKILYSKTTSSGIWYSKLQGASSAVFLAFALDMYGLANAEVELSGSFTWAEPPALVEFSQYNLGAKNASSAGYQSAFMSHHFWRTGV